MKITKTTYSYKLNYNYSFYFKKNEYLAEINNKIFIIIIIKLDYNENYNELKEAIVKG